MVILLTDRIFALMMIHLPHPNLQKSTTLLTIIIVLAHPRLQMLMTLCLHPKLKKMKKMTMTMTITALNNLISIIPIALPHIPHPLPQANPTRILIIIVVLRCPTLIPRLVPRSIIALSMTLVLALTTVPPHLPMLQMSTLVRPIMMTLLIRGTITALNTMMTMILITTTMRMMMTTMIILPTNPFVVAAATIPLARMPPMAVHLTIENDPPPRYFTQTVMHLIVKVTTLLFNQSDYTLVAQIKLPFQTTCPMTTNFSVAHLAHAQFQTVCPLQQNPNPLSAATLTLTQMKVCYQMLSLFSLTILYLLYFLFHSNVITNLTPFSFDILIPCFIIILCFLLHSLLLVHANCSRKC